MVHTYKLLVLLFILVSCSSRVEKPEAIVDSHKRKLIDTPVVVFQNNNLVIKSQSLDLSADIPEVHTKFSPYIHFGDFAVNEIHRGSKALLKLDKTSDFWTFRTRIRNSYADSLNFAGKYCFVVWGCGSSCQMSVIIDATSGKIYKGPEATQGYRYQLDSRMLIVNPPQEEVQFENGETSPAVWLNCDYCQPEIYIWNEDLKIFEERSPKSI